MVLTWTSNACISVIGCLVVLGEEYGVKKTRSCVSVAVTLAHHALHTDCNLTRIWEGMWSTAY